MTRAATELGLCQVRSTTDRPCPRPAMLEIWGVPFCEQCAREQEAYFAIGELTQGPAADREKQAWGLRDESLVEMLGQMRWQFARRIVEAKCPETARRGA